MESDPNFYRNGNFSSALNCCRTLLNTDPENGWGYFYRAMAELQLCDEKMLVNVDWNGNSSLLMAQRFGDDDLKMKIFQLIAAQNSSMPQAEDEPIVIGAEFLAEQDFVANDSLLRQECQNRLALLNQYLNHEITSQKRPAVINVFNQSIIAENNLLSYSGRLTVEIVQPIKIASENAMFTAGNDPCSNIAAVAKPKKKGLLIFSVFAAVIVLAVGIYFLVNSGNLSSDDVCDVENNVVVGLKFDKKDIDNVPNFVKPTQELINKHFC